MSKIISRMLSLIIVSCLLFMALEIIYNIGPEATAEYIDGNLTGWRSAYYYKIMETFDKWTEIASSSDMEKWPVQFTIYDMNKDGIPELLVQDYWKTTVYEYVKGNGIYPGQDAVKIGELDSHHTVLCSYPDGNGVIVFHNGTDATVVKLLYYYRGNLNEKLLYSKNGDSDYQKSPKNFVHGSQFLTMYDLLDDYVFWEYERTVN